MRAIYWWVALIILIVILLVYKKALRVYHRSRLDHYLTTTLPPEIGKLDPQSISHGFEEMKRSTCVIAGLIRNGEKHVARIKNQLNDLAKHFKEYRILIVENDSTDNTRKALLRWRDEDPNMEILGCGVNEPKCILNLPRTRDHEPDRKRIVKMAYLRNLYLDHLIQHYADFDYLLVIDLDLVGAHYLDGVASSFDAFAHRPMVDGISANGRMFDSDSLSLGRYYDPFAHRTLGSAHEFKTRVEKDAWDRTVNAFNPMLNDGIVRIISGFGGLAIYRISSIIKYGARYAPPSEGHLGCEHVPFNAALPRFYINPGMLFIVLENDAL